LLLGLTNASQSGTCPGPNREPHPYGTFTFYTNSRVDQISQGGFSHGVVSCLDHNDPINNLKVHWLIPLLHGWVPPTEILESIPRMRIGNQAPQLPGCLLYGDRGDTTSAIFLGIEGDDRKVEDERTRGCVAVVENPNPPTGFIQDVLFRIRNFFPSNPKNPKSTMLELDGTVGIKWSGADRYNSFFEYEVKRYLNSEGSPQSVMLRPAFRGVTETLLPAFTKENPKPINLGTSGRISFNVFDVVAPQLAYASYDLYGQENEQVAGISFPVFVPKR